MKSGTAMLKILIQMKRLLLAHVFQMCSIQAKGDGIGHVKTVLFLFSLYLCCGRCNYTLFDYKRRDVTNTVKVMKSRNQRGF